MGHRGIVLSFFLLVTVCWAQTFQQLKDQAAALLVQHDKDVANQVKVAWDQPDKAAHAGDLLMKAAGLAPDEVQRFQALESAGQAYKRSSALKKSDIEAYRGARDLASIAPADRARAGLELAKLTRKKEDYLFVVGISAATPQNRATAYSGLGEVARAGAKDNPSLYEDVVEYAISEAAELAKFNKSESQVRLGIAMVTATKIPDRQKAVAALERLDKIHKDIVVPGTSHLGDAVYDLSLATRLMEVGAEDKALALWRKVGGNTKSPPAQREEAWLKAAELHKKRNQIDLALSSLTEAAKPRSENFIFSETIATQKMELYDQAKRPQEALAEVTRLLAHPKVTIEGKTRWVPQQARRLESLGKVAEAHRVLEVFAADPGAKATTLVLACRERVRIFASRQEYAAARDLVDGVKAQMGSTSAQSEPFSDLLLLSAELSMLEKKPLQAHSELQQSSRSGDGRYRPNGQVVYALLRNVEIAIKAGQIEAAGQIVDETGRLWSMHPIVNDVLAARYAAATRQTEAAQKHLAEARLRLNGLPAAERTFMQAQVDDIASGLPK